MTFGAPEMLWSLLLLPLALLGYLARRRSVTRYAVRFTGVPGLKLAAAAVPRWRRHLPAALALAALAALGLALAKPQRTSAVAVDRALCRLARDYAAQVERDHQALVAAVARGTLPVEPRHHRSDT